jgi:Flp pilus assembly protein TadG
MKRLERTIRSERGAVFVQVGISIFVLMAFNVFVLDYGVMWTARRQAQNAADAGALAGAVARGYDDFDDPPDPGGLAANIAETVAEANPIWNEAGVAEVSFTCPAGVTGRCSRVNVFRDTAHGNPIDMLFGPVLGLTAQDVRATATALAGNGNSTNCMRPIAFPDAWLENGGNNQFNQYFMSGPNAGQLYTPIGSRDSYTAPSASQTGRTTVSADLGERIVWDVDRPANAAITRTTAGNNDPTLLVALDLPGAGSFLADLQVCSGEVVQLGQTLPAIIPTAGETTTGLNYLMALDPTADWNDVDSRVEGGCAPGCAPISPRLVPVALFDPARYQLGRSLSPPNWTHPDVGCPTNSPCVTVTNIVGFFVHGVAGSYSPHGHILKYPGLTASGAPNFVDDASWLVTMHLVR